MKIYQTYRQSDEVEGRGAKVPDFAFLHKEHADRYVDAQPGVMGMRAQWSKEEYGDWEVRAIEVFDFDVIEAGEQQIKARMKALAKLTAEEIELLGIDENFKPKVPERPLRGM